MHLTDGGKSYSEQEQQPLVPTRHKTRYNKSALDRAFSMPLFTLLNSIHVCGLNPQPTEGQHTVKGSATLRHPGLHAICETALNVSYRPTARLMDIDTAGIPAVLRTWARPVFVVQRRVPAAGRSTFPFIACSLLALSLRPEAQYVTVTSLEQVDVPASHTRYV